MQVQTIVVGVDGSRNSDRAADAAGDLAQAFGASIVAVHAVGLLEGAPEQGEARVERRQEIRHDLETRWTDPLRRTEVPVRCELRDGDPIGVLLDVAHEVGADLIVVGRHGHRLFPEQVLGSASAAVASTAPCPVVVVPDAPRRADSTDT